MAGLPARMMPAFSRPIDLAVGAEELGVVDVDAGDDGAVGVEGVDRVEPAAEAHLEDHQVERRRCAAGAAIASVVNSK